MVVGQRIRGKTGYIFKEVLNMGKMVSIFWLTCLLRHFGRVFHFMPQLLHSILIEGSLSTTVHRQSVLAERKSHASVSPALSRA